MEPYVRSAQHARNTQDVVTSWYGVMEHMQNTYDSGAKVSNVPLHAKLMKLQKTYHSIAFLSLESP